MLKRSSSGFCGSQTIENGCQQNDKPLRDQLSRFADTKGRHDDEKQGEGKNPEEGTPDTALASAEDHAAQNGRSNGQNGQFMTHPDTAIDAVWTSDASAVIKPAIVWATMTVLSTGTPENCAATGFAPTDDT